MAFRTSGIRPGGDRPTVDDLVVLSVKLHQALADLPRPEFLGRRDDVLARADRVTWGEEKADLDAARGGRWFGLLAGSVRPVPLRDQVVHADMYSSVRFDDDGSATVVHFRPFCRPAEWATALVVVDAVTAGSAGAELIVRWSHLAYWRQMLLRATMFRIAAHAIDPGSPGAVLDRLRKTAGIVSEFG